MSGVQAVKFVELQCGKKIQGTKKRFQWTFSVNDNTHVMELASSTLSGKKVVTLNSQEIHSEQSILNIDFDFIHNIQGHVLRISRVPDFVNKYELRIDNRDFQELMANKGSGKQIKSEKSIYKKVQNDPFSDFAAASKQNIPKESSNNEFGQFDFDSFSNNAPQKTQSTQQTKPVPTAKVASSGKTAASSKNFDFDFSAPAAKKSSSQNYETINLQSNNFQTTNNIDQFFQNFKKFDETANDEDCFATNAYNKNNFYNDLMYQTPEEKEYYAKFNKPPEEAEEEPKQKPGFLAEKIGNIKIELSAKQVLNKVKQAAQSIKMKITGQEESLI